MSVGSMVFKDGVLVDGEAGMEEALGADFRTIWINVSWMLDLSGR